MDFNPRPREEGDLTVKSVAFSSDMISIHALVKRATLLKIGVKSNKIVISIHALVKRATNYQIIFGRGILYFNPRPREEGDQ